MNKISFPELFSFYRELFSLHGPQGWWPVAHSAAPSGPAAHALDRHGYHPGDYTIPLDRRQSFEICLGAILTQNTTWKNAASALSFLAAENILSAEGVLSLPQHLLALLVRPAGYYNQKAKKLRAFAHFFLNTPSPPSRQALLGLWGIGPETADSMLLYAFKQLEMVIDAYSRRILAHHGFVDSRASYDEAKAFCVRALPPSLIVYQEFHALMVAHAKQHFTRRAVPRPQSPRCFAGEDGYTVH